MDSIITKLEEFGLDNFITSHRFELCSRTVNQNQVAAFLGVDGDQICIMMHPPDNYSRNEKLYENIGSIATVKSFLAALEQTGNQHLIPFIQSARMDSSSTGPIFSSKHGIWSWNMPQLIPSFLGREDFLNRLHAQIQFPVEDSLHLHIISGLGGMGKTQTARKYISKYFESYDNFIWIDAESESSMRNSFVPLAIELRIPLENSEGKSRDIDKIVKDIYNKISESRKSTLIVFDNAEDYEGCKKCLPFLSHPKMQKPEILVTSRNQEWPSTISTSSSSSSSSTSRTTTVKIQVLPLEVLANSECIEFILKELEISYCSEFRHESKEFIELIGGLPLALQQAVAYIKGQRELNQSLGRPYKISDYVHEFKSRMNKLQDFSPNPASASVVSDTWNVTFEKIRGLENGEEAIKLLELLPFLYADKIPLSFLRSLAPQVEEHVFTQSIRLLKKYSLITIKDSDSSISIHRQLQFSVLQSLQSETNKIIVVSTSVIEKCRVALQNVKLAESSDTFLNVHQIVNNPFNLIPMDEKFVDFMNEFVGKLSEASRYKESFDLCKKVHSKYADLLGDENPKTIQSQFSVAKLLMDLGKYDESFVLFNQTLRKQQAHPDLGEEHPETITTRYLIAYNLQKQKKYTESLILFQQVLEQRKNVLGENHSSTLNVYNMIALLHMDLGDNHRALTLFEELEKKQIEMLGVDHIIVLTTKNNKASALCNLGRFQEASTIFHEVYEKRKEMLGENHIATTIALEFTGNTLYEEGKWAEALNVQRKVYEIRKAALGEDHPYTIHTKTNIDIVSHNIKAKNEDCVIA